MEITITCECGEKFTDAESEQERARQHVLDKHKDAETLTFSIQLPVAEILKELE